MSINLHIVFRRQKPLKDFFKERYFNHNLTLLCVTSAPAVAAPPKPAAPVAPAAPTPAPAPVAARPGGQVLSTPYARTLAAERGVDLNVR